MYIPMIFDPLIILPIANSAEERKIHNDKIRDLINVYRQSYSNEIGCYLKFRKNRTEIYCDCKTLDVLLECLSGKRDQVVNELPIALKKQFI